MTEIQPIRVDYNSNFSTLNKLHDKYKAEQKLEKTYNDPLIFPYDDEQSKNIKKAVRDVEKTLQCPGSSFWPSGWRNIEVGII